MADKIANFEDYKKREAGVEEMQTPVEKEVSVQDTEAPKGPGDETLTAMEIKIEDPENFFNEKEREEYIQARQESAPKAEKKPVRKEAPRREEAKPRPRREEPRYEEPEDYDEDYDEEDYDEEDSGVNMDLVVRIASIITGIMILIFIAFAVKVKVIDKMFPKDQDEVETVVTALALPEGFIEKNDTVMVTGAQLLNLRSGPDTSSTPVGLLPEGAEVKRIAVNKEGTWALVEVDGQQYYASMKYLTEKK